jgi:DNA (cytosine-5)-methyltransferase 1
MDSEVVWVPDFSFALETMANPYLSVKETSEILNCSEQYVRQLLRHGEISGEKMSSRWIVASESVENYRIKGEETHLNIPDHRRRSFSKPELKALSFFLAVWVWT